MSNEKKLSGEHISRRGFVATTLAAGLAGASRQASAAVSERAVEVPIEVGTSDSYLYQPETEGPHPGVIMYTNISGVRPVARDMARALAEQGYVVLLPNHYARVARAPFDPIPDLSNPDDLSRMRALASQITPDTIVRDVESYADYILALPSVNGRLGVVGYCMTGKHAMHTAAVAPDSVLAMVSIHGGRLVTDAPDSPHTVLPQIKAPMMYLHATNDGSMNAEAIGQLERFLEEGGHRYISEVFPAAHGWTLADSPTYDETEARRAWDYTVNFLREHLLTA